MFYLAKALSRMTESLLNFSDSTPWPVKALRLILVTVVLIVGIIVVFARIHYNLTRS
jgi:hypothetical protein